MIRDKLPKKPVFIMITFLSLTFFYPFGRELTGENQTSPISSFFIEGKNEALLLETLPFTTDRISKINPITNCRSETKKLYFYLTHHSSTGTDGKLIAMMGTNKYIYLYGTENLKFISKKFINIDIENIILFEFVDEDKILMLSKKDGLLLFDTTTLSISDFKTKGGKNKINIIGIDNAVITKDKSKVFAFNSESNRYYFINLTKEDLSGEVVEIGDLDLQSFLPFILSGNGDIIYYAKSIKTENNKTREHLVSYNFKTNVELLIENHLLGNTSLVQLKLLANDTILFGQFKKVKQFNDLIFWDTKTTEKLFSERKGPNFSPRVIEPTPKSDSLVFFLKNREIYRINENLCRSSQFSGSKR